MSISSLYLLPEFLDDRAEVVVERVKQHEGMKLLTVAQDFELHTRLEKLGLRNDQSLNMYDWLQGALDAPDRGIDYDMRVLPRYDKRNTILAPADTNGVGHVDVLSEGRKAGQINYLSGFTSRTKSVDLYDHNNMRWAEDLYDVRGFLSRRRTYNPDGTLGLETVYHVDGTPVLEISHMGDKSMFRLLGTHGLPNWLLRNELSLMLWWYGRILTDGELVYNDDPLLDPVWTQLEDRLKLTEVAHIQSTDLKRVDALRDRAKTGTKIVAVNQHVSDVYKFAFKNPWVDGQPVKQAKYFGPKRVALVGVWVNDDVVKQLIQQIFEIVKIDDAIQVHLFGYFTTDSENTYKELLKKNKLEDRVNVHGNLVGAERKRVLQQCALAVWLPLGDESTVKPALLNHYGLPVVTTVKGFRGAVLPAPTAEFVAQGVNMGLDNIKKWRDDVADQAK